MKVQSLRNDLKSSGWWGTEGVLAVIAEALGFFDLHCSDEDP